jgi:citrate lyase beta subunit
MSELPLSFGPIRSELSVPGNDLRKIEKALTLDADAIFLDLEDSVAPNRKEAARAVVGEALSHFDWGRLPRAVRVNGIGTRWCYADLIAVVEGAGHSVDKVVVPKVRSVGDIAFVDRLLSQLEQQIGRSEPIRIEVQIEDAIGLIAVREIAQASARVTELTFGQGDFAAATGMPAAGIGVADQWDAAVNGDRWLFPRQTIVFAAKAASVRAVNGPYAAFRDHQGFRDYCRMSRAIGFAGVWCIHPDQIVIANETFAPTADEIEQAKATIAALDEGWSDSRGAVSHESVMVDEASVRMARSILDAASQIAQRE